MGVPKRIIQMNDTNTIIENSKLDVDNKYGSDNHSTDIELNDSTDLVNRISCSINCGCQIKDRCSFMSGLHKNEDEYGKGSIRRRVRVDGYGGARRTADLKFKCVWDTEDAIRRTMGVHVRVLAVVGLVLMLLATSAAAPARSRLGRSTHLEKNAKSYLEAFGYLRRGHPEVGNLLMGDVSQSYEDDFRIAIKTLQEFGGIPVTGVVDHATKELMKKKRCGRPDREPENDENGRRKKRFAVQGEKWKHTNLTWSYHPYLSADTNTNWVDISILKAFHNIHSSTLYSPGYTMR